MNLEKPENGQIETAEPSRFARFLASLKGYNDLR